MYGQRHSFRRQVSRCSLAPSRYRPGGAFRFASDGPSPSYKEAKQMSMTVFVWILVFLELLLLYVIHK